METLHGIVKLRYEQYEELLKNGSIQYGEQTIVYDPYVLYFTDEDVNEQIKEGLVQIKDFSDAITKTLLNTNHTESQDVNAEEAIIGSTINLHKVAKTGQYSDLIGKLEFASEDEAIAGAVENKVISPKTLNAALTLASTGAAGNIFVFKGAVAEVSNLPESGNRIGDVYYVKDGSTCYIWIEDEQSVKRWEEFGPALDVSNYNLATTTEAGVVKSSNAVLEVGVNQTTGVMTVNGLGNFIIEHYRGTSDDLINIKNTLPSDRLIYISGCVWVDGGGSAKKYIYLEHKYLALKRQSKLFIYDAFISNDAVTNSNYGTVATINKDRPGEVCIISYDYGVGNGHINHIQNVQSVSRLNGTTAAGNKDFYAPLTSGTSGQILQSNGENSAPTWVDMPEQAQAGIKIRRI